MHKHLQTLTTRSQHFYTTTLALQNFTTQTNFTNFKHNFTQFYNLDTTMHKFTKLYTNLLNSFFTLQNFCKIFANKTTFHKTIQNITKTLKTNTKLTQLYNTLQISTQLRKKCLHIIVQKLYTILQNFTKLWIKTLHTCTELYKIEPKYKIVHNCILLCKQYTKVYTNYTLEKIIQNSLNCSTHF
jgi:hypothetical protein